ncbi:MULTISPECIES: hypothetical protein [Mycobacteroides]|uniref:hypothetical protein n=1 Tax=Mycobacteroides sp. H072 TaxID=1720568 RepID=UPI001F2691AF|nr:MULTISPECIES: hypothetical protein [Mycobacteroides]
MSGYSSLEDLPERGIFGQNGILRELLAVAPGKYPAPFRIIECVDLAEWGVARGTQELAQVSQTPI